MKKILSLRYLTSACFLALLGFMLAGSLRPCYYIAYHQLQNLRSGSGISTAQIEYEFNDSLPEKQQYITLNGGFQRLLGVRYINDRYRMDNGHLTYVIPETDVSKVAENTVTLRDDLAEMGIPFVYINTLFKIDPEDKQLPAGVEDWSNENADRFLSILRENGVNTLDLRQLEKEQGLDHYDLFFMTDHHWTAETGFWAYTQILSCLEELDSSFAVDSALTDPENYERTVYTDIFCGSAARRVGPLYAGLDDLTLITPRFDTQLQFDAPEYGVYREGSFRDTLIFGEYLDGSVSLETNNYEAYLGGEYPVLYLRNDSRQRGLEVQSSPKKLLVLKDSMLSVVAPYLALSYDEVCLVDLRLFERDFTEFVREYQPDMVAIVYNPGALETHNHNMFRYRWE